MSTSPVQQHIRHADRFFIGGGWAKPSSGPRIDVGDSATEDVFPAVAEAQVEDVDRAVEAARKVFDDGSWPRLSHRERAVLVREPVGVAGVIIPSNAADALLAYKRRGDVTNRRRHPADDLITA
jgi:acyl-CoA reductase-like NAD-dependent aldehyde dehydrogenase